MALKGKNSKHEQGYIRYKTHLSIQKAEIFKQDQSSPIKSISSKGAQKDSMQKPTESCTCFAYIKRKEN